MRRVRAHSEDLYPLTRRIARRCGYDLVRANFYSPIPDLARLPESVWTDPSPMPGVELRLGASYEFLETELAGFIAEYAPPDDKPGTRYGYYRQNAMYGHLDGEVLYAMVRHLRPGRVVEIGAGFSTLVVADALARNANEGKAADHQVFDPFPSPVLVPLRASGEAKIQALDARQIPDGVFGSLMADDVLFIDTTHTVKPHNDVLRLLLEVLPTLARGVVVQIHDFFRPFEYPRFLAERHGAYWQEQYLVQAFLAHNDAFRVLLANHAMVRADPERVGAVVPRLPPTHPGSALWLEKVQ